MTEGERREPPLHADERATLNGFLDAQRDTLEWKCSGLSPEQLKEESLSPSRLTLLGLLRHMTEVEYFWMEAVLLGKGEHLGFYSGEANPAAGIRAWTDLDSHTVEDVFRNWKEACEASRVNAGSLDSMSSVAAHEWDEQPVTLRWITTHM